MNSSNVFSDVQISKPSNSNHFPFFCPICKAVDEGKEYLRFYFKNDPNGVCVHSDCLTKNIFPSSVR